MNTVLTPEDIQANEEFYDEMEKAIQEHTIKLEPESSEAESNSEIIKANFKAVFKEDKIGFYQLIQAVKFRYLILSLNLTNGLKQKEMERLCLISPAIYLLTKEQIPFERFHASIFIRSFLIN